MSHAAARDDLESLMGAVRAYTHEQLGQIGMNGCKANDGEAIGLDAGEARFSVPEINDRNKKRPTPIREDGINPKNPRAQPYGPEWMQEWNTRQDLLARHPLYSFIKLVAGHIPIQDITRAFNVQNVRSRALAAEITRRIVQLQENMAVSEVGKLEMQLQQLEAEHLNIRTEEETARARDEIKRQIDKLIDRRTATKATCDYAASVADAIDPLFIFLDNWRNVLSTPEGAARDNAHRQFLQDTWPLLMNRAPVLKDGFTRSPFSSTVLLGPEPALKIIRAVDGLSRAPVARGGAVIVDDGLIDDALIVQEAIERYNIESESHTAIFSVVGVRFQPYKAELDRIGAIGTLKSAISNAETSLDEIRTKITEETTQYIEDVNNLDTQILILERKRFKTPADISTLQTLEERKDSLQRIHEANMKLYMGQEITTQDLKTQLARRLDQAMPAGGLRMSEGLLGAMQALRSGLAKYIDFDPIRTWPSPTAFMAFFGTTESEVNRVYPALSLQAATGRRFGLAAQWAIASSRILEECQKREVEIEAELVEERTRAEKLEEARARARLLQEQIDVQRTTERARREELEDLQYRYRQDYEWVTRPENSGIIDLDERIVAALNDAYDLAKSSLGRNQSVSLDEMMQVPPEDWNTKKHGRYVPNNGARNHFAKLAASLYQITAADSGQMYVSEQTKATMHEKRDTLVETYGQKFQVGPNGRIIDRPGHSTPIVPMQSVYDLQRTLAGRPQGYSTSRWVNSSGNPGAYVNDNI